MAEIAGIEVVGGRMRTSIHVDHPPCARAAAGEHQNALGFGQLINQKAERSVELARAAGSDAANVRISFVLRPAPFLPVSPPKPESQYPVWPGGALSSGWPSGQRGVGPEGGFCFAAPRPPRPFN